MPGGSTACILAPGAAALCIEESEMANYREFYEQTRRRKRKAAWRRFVAAIVVLGAVLAAALSALLVPPTAAAARFPFLPTERSASYPPLAEVAMIIALTGSRAAAERVSAPVKYSAASIIMTA